MRTRNIVMPAAGCVELIERELTEPGPEDVQVKLHSSIISPGTEGALIAGKAKPWLPLPFPLGYSASGTVVRAGERVKIPVGTRVAANMPHASIACVPANLAFPMADHVSFEAAAMVELGVIALQGVRKARIELGESVVVVGLGLIGQLAMQIARASGAGMLVVMDPMDSRRALAMKLGATAALDPMSADFKADYSRLCPQGASVVIEATGAPAGVAGALAATAKMGRLILLGSVREPCTVDLYREVHVKGVAMIGAHVCTTPQNENSAGLWARAAEARCFLALLADGRLQPAPLITHHETPEQAVALLQSGRLVGPDRLGTRICWQVD